MADETLDIKVDDGGSTTTVTNNLQKLATTAESVGESVDTINTSLDGNSASFDKASTAVKGYVDENGNYIRQVGSNATATKSAQTATDSLKTSISAMTIEQGRAAAGYGALNSATTSSVNANSSFDASVKALNTELGTFGNSAPAAASSVGTLASANTAAASAATAHGTAATGAGRAVQSFGGSTTAGAAAVAAWRAANTSAGAAAEDHGNKVQSAGSKLGAFNETVLSLIRQLGLLAVAFVSVQAANLASQQTQARNALANTGQTAEQLSATLKSLGTIQSQTGVGIVTLAQQYRAGLTQFVALNQGGEGVITMMQQLATLSAQNGNSLAQYGAVAGNVFNSFKAGISTMQTVNALEAQGPGFMTALVQAYQQLTNATGNSEQVSQKFASALAQGRINVAQFEVILSQAAAGMNQNANVSQTLAGAYGQLTGSLNEYVGTSAQGATLSNLLTAALVTMSQYPGVLVAGFTALAVAIAAIGLASTITAFTTLGATLVTVAGFFGVTSAAAAVITAGFVALVGVVAGILTALYNFNSTLQDNANKLGFVTQYVAGLSSAVVTVIDWIGQAVKIGYDWATSFEYVRGVIQVLNSVLGSVGSAIGSFLDKITTSAQSFGQRFGDLKSRIDAFNQSIGTTAKPMASINQLMADGSGAALQYVPGLAQAATNTTALGTASTSTSNALNSLVGSLQNATAGTGTFDSAASHLAQEMLALRTDVGVFDQATIDSNASMSNLQKVADQASGSLDKLGASFKQAGADAQYFAIQSKDANTVAGQIGGGTLSGMNFDDNIISLGYSGAGGYSADDIQRMRNSQMATEAEYKARNDKQQQYYDDLISGKTSLSYNNGLTPLPTATTADGTTSAATTANTSASNDNTSAIAANTAALNANTAATTTTLPDLLTASGQTKLNVGSSISQTTMADGTVAVTGTNIPGFVPTVTAATSTGSNTVAPITPVVNPSADDPISTWNSQMGGDMRGPVADNNNLIPNRAPVSSPVINLTIKSDDYGQFQRSQRQIAQDVGNRIANAVSSGAA